MRRAIQQGRVLGLEAPYLERFAERAIDLLGEAYPQLEEHRETVIRWVGDEEQSFGRTLDRGSELLARAGRRREGVGDRRGWTPPTPSACTTPTGFPTTSPGSCLRPRGSRSTTPASRS